MKIAAIQHDVIWENPSANHERLSPMVAQAASDGAELVVLSEMYSTGFSMASDKIAEKPEGESETFLSEQAKIKNLWMAASVPTKDRLRSRAIENQAYVVGVNRVGEGDGLSYQGDSAIIDPLGEVIKEASSEGEEILIADIEPERVSEVRKTFPFINDRSK